METLSDTDLNTYRKHLKHFLSLSQIVFNVAQESNDLFDFKDRKYSPNWPAVAFYSFIDEYKYMQEELTTLVNKYSHLKDSQEYKQDLMDIALLRNQCGNHANMIKQYFPEEIIKLKKENYKNEASFHQAIEDKMKTARSLPQIFKTQQLCKKHGWEHWSNL